nr:MAG TPA: hypothetical protein [Inoviridae sp.]
MHKIFDFCLQQNYIKNCVAFALNMALNYFSPVWTKHLFGAMLNGVSNK